MATAASVAIVGGTEIAREGLKRVLADRGFHVGHSGARADRLGGAEPAPTLILLDVAISNRAAIKSVRKSFPSAKIVLLCDNLGTAAVDLAAAGTVDQLLLKSIGADDFAGALRLNAVQLTIPAMPAAEEVEVPEHLAVLTPREREVLQLMTLGDVDKDIGEKLNITKATAKVHVRAILRKLNKVNRNQVAIWAAAKGGRHAHSTDPRAPLRVVRAH